MGFLGNGCSSNLKMRNPPSTEKETLALNSSIRPKNHGDIIFWSLIASLTRFIPLPLVDDLIEDSLEEKMISGIAKAHGVTLSDSDLDVLTFKTSDFSGVKVAVKSATRLASRLFLKTFVVFELKDASDTFSAAYHVGYLLDFAYETGWSDKCSAAELRVAIDRVCDQTGTSPVNRVFIGIMKKSLSKLGSVKDFITGLFSAKTNLEKTPETIEADAPPEAKELVHRLEKALDLMPPEYFLELQKRFTATLEKVSSNENPTD